MKALRSLTVVYFFFLLLAFSTAAQTTKITAAEAKDHVGEVRTVCGKVVSTHYASGSKGQPTFLNLDEPYPKEVFTILIWGSDRAKFGTPETKYKDASVCVTGKITSYRGKPEIIATEPRQIVQER
jgi:DNA/RNA endonuclease YhcR with UshA esterase domain